MTDTFVVIDGEIYPIVLSVDLARRGALAEEGDYIPAIGRGGVLQRAFWSFSSPMGQSRSYADECFTDYAISLEHRFNGILTNPPARNSLSFTERAPEGTVLIYGGGVTYGAGDTYAGRSTASGQFVAIHDESDSLFVVRDGVMAKLNPLTMTIDEYVTFDHPVTDMLLGQDGRGYVLHGDAATMSRRVLTTTPHSYEGVQDGLGADVKGVKGVTGGFRTFISDPTSRHIAFTADGFASVSGQFPVGPTDQDPNGLGSWSGFTFAGYDAEISSFTDVGNATPLLTTPLIGLRSDINGSQWVEQWGFNYTITRRGVFVVSSRDYGIVDLNALKDFEGPIGGEPIAITAIGESLMVAYQDDAGSTHIVRGEFDSRVTPGGGQPIWFAFDTIPGKRVVAMEPTGLRPAPTLLAIDEEGTIYWWEMGTRARAIADASYELGEAAGEWYGATLMTEPNRINHARKVLIHSEAGEWTLRVKLDEGDWREAGSVSEAGYTRLDLRSEGVRFHNLKPRLDLTAGGGTLRGILEIEYLEQPEMVEVRVWQVLLGEDREDVLANLRRLLDPEQQRAPVSFTTPEGEERQGWIVEQSLSEIVDRRDTGVRGLVEPVKTVEIGALLW